MLNYPVGVGEGYVNTCVQKNYINILVKWTYTVYGETISRKRTFQNMSTNRVIN